MARVNATLVQRFPLTTLIAYSATVLGVLVVLQGSGVLHGKVAHWVDLAVGVLQVVLTSYARQHVTPIADPKDDMGRQLVPVGTARRDS